MVFIPFLGAAIFAPHMGNRYVEAFVGYGGPFLGSIAALLCLLAWGITGWDILLSISFIGVYLNLFNMIPIRPLDGGRILQIVGERIKYFGLVVLIAYTVYMGEPSLIILWVFLLQEFDLSLWWRPVIAGMLTISMGVLFLMGHSGQPWQLDFLDMFIGVAFTFLYLWVDGRRYAMARSQDYYTPLPIPDDARPYPDRSMRLTWLVLYLGLVVILWAALWFQIEHLPVPPG